MKLALAAASVALLALSVPTYAQGASDLSAGHKMQRSGDRDDHGASRFAPGHEGMREGRGSAIDRDRDDRGGKDLDRNRARMGGDHDRDDMSKPK